MAWVGVGGLADLANRAVESTFGQSVVYNGNPVTAVFDERHAIIDAEGELDFSGTAPVLTVRLASLSAAPVQGDMFTVGGQDYEVTDVHPDGPGSAKLVAVEG